MVSFTPEAPKIHTIEVLSCLSTLLGTLTFLFFLFDRSSSMVRLFQVMFLQHFKRNSSTYTYTVVITGCPFICKISDDTSRVSVSLRNMELVAVGEMAQFEITVDGTENSELAVSVRGNV